VRAQPQLADALRISVGSDADNASLLAALAAPGAA
jgi:histidinol-phosphate/aromatic aminotransferase/cobyric acid decarboxylase-like protein